MQIFRGSKASGSAASDVIFDTLCRGRSVQNSSGFPYVLKCLAAYQPNFFPRTERVCRLARIANLPVSEASIKLQLLDATVDYSSLEHVSLLDPALKYAYENDTGSSGLEPCSSFILSCREATCLFCSKLLPPPHDSHDTNVTRPNKSKENGVKVITECGAFDLLRNGESMSTRSVRAKLNEKNATFFRKCERYSTSWTTLERESE